MRLHSNLFSLPAPILLLLNTYTEPVLAAENSKVAARWPSNLLSNLNIWPSSPASRDAQPILENCETHARPVGVMKMSDDEGEKFYMEYWQFEKTMQQTPLLGMAPSTSLRARDLKEEARLLSNASMPILFRPPFSLHKESVLDNQDLRARGAAALALLEGRDFTCPTGTTSCGAIGYPNSCCATGETCFQIQDTGLGPVGCCPGSNCGGTITNCAAPNTACPDTLGGGCCIPGYVCAGVGCVMTSTFTEIVTLTSTAYSSSAESSQIQTQTVITVITPITSSSIPPVSTNPTSTYTGLQTTLACSSNSHACPVGMGGGCCGNDYACASQSSCIATSSAAVSTASSATNTGVVPVRPTGDTTTLPSSTDAATSCPVGFYGCSAYHGGGCCRTGRNCDVTSCPATSSTTIVSSGVTVVVPIGTAATTTSPSGTCATGWSTCAPSLGGNCCPSGYGCGTASCEAVDATSTVVRPKEAPSSGVRLEGSVVFIFGMILGVLVLTL